MPALCFYIAMSLYFKVILVECFHGHPKYIFDLRILALQILTSKLFFYIYRRDVIQLSLTMHVISQEENPVLIH